MEGTVLQAYVKLNPVVLQKSVLFTPETTVKEAMEQIASKCSLSDPDVTKSYLLYIPKSQSNDGIYLYNLDAKILSCHTFINRDKIEMRPTAFGVICNYLEEEHKLPPLDLEHSVFELLLRLCKQFDCAEKGALSNFELCLINSPVNPPKILVGNKTLGSQGITSNTTIYMRRKKGISDRLKFSRNDKKPSKKTKLSDSQTKKISAFPIFGQPLTSALRSRNGETNAIPLIVRASIDYLERNAMDLEGIFRKPGIAMQIEQLKEKVDSLEVEPDFSSVSDPHLVCSLLKQYLRDLPDPLIPYSLYDEFMLLANEAEKEGWDSPAMAEKLKVPLKQLPEANHNLLYVLTKFLYRVSTHEAENKMSARNLSLVFGPNLFRYNGEDMLIIMRDSHRINELTYQLIHLSSELFPFDPKLEKKEKKEKKKKEKEKEKEHHASHSHSPRTSSSPRSNLKAVYSKSDIEHSLRSEHPSPSGSKGYCKVLISFPKEEGIMECKVGDVILITEMLPSGWGFGRVINSPEPIEGYFPSNYCTSIVKSHADIDKLTDEVVTIDKATDDLESMFISQFQAHCDDLFQQFSLLTSMLSN